VLLVPAFAETIEIEPLDKWLKHQSTFKTVTANFLQKRKLTTLNKEVVTEGKLWVEYPAKFHWQMGIPSKAVILRNGDDMQFQNFGKGTVSSFKADSDEGRRYAFMTSSFANSAEEFLKSFEIERTWKKEGVYFCLFKPKSIAVRKRVPFLALGIQQTTNQLALFEMHLKDKSVIRTEFVDYKSNVKVDSTKFKLIK